MFSMVLMAALTTGTDIPDWGRHGCRGCWGGCWGGYGMGWGGCWGGYGRGWGGCWGGGYGCWGGWGGYGWGGGYGGWGGGYGGWGGWGGLGYVYAPYAITYAAPTAMVYNPIPAAVPPTTTRSMYPDASAGNRATITVHLPEAATLTVDGKPTTSTSASRQFYSPPLEPGRTYHYTFAARLDRDGQTVKTERTVDVSAGDRRDITITLPDVNPPSDRQQTAKPEENKAIRDRRRAGG